MMTLRLDHVTLLTYIENDTICPFRKHSTTLMPKLSALKIQIAEQNSHETKESEFFPNSDIHGSYYHSSIYVC
jgi:hypothetical protein